MTQGRDKTIQYLERAGKEMPEYAETAALFSGLYRYDRGAGLKGISFAADPGAGEFPLIGPERLAVDEAAAAKYLLGLLDYLVDAAREGKPDLAHIREALEGKRLPLAELFRSLLSRDR